MRNCCEICEHWLSHPQRTDTASRFAEVVFGRRRIVLCQTHAFIAAELGVTTIGGLSLAFRENHGRRSLLPRRSATRAATAEPGPRRRAGRRSTDLN
jgi:hypothetical protein